MRDKLTVKFTTIDGALHPRFATPGAACADLAVHSVIKLNSASPFDCELQPGERAMVGTGVMMAIPNGYEGVIRGRSGLGKRGLEVHVGTIDSDYRGEVCVLVRNAGEGPMALTVGMRVAQIAFRAAPEVALEWVDDLDETARGAGGFGSTGI